MLERVVMIYKIILNFTDTLMAVLSFVFISRFHD